MSRWAFLLVIFAAIAFGLGLMLVSTGLAPTAGLISWGVAAVAFLIGLLIAAFPRQPQPEAVPVPKPTAPPGAIMGWLRNLSVDQIGLALSGLMFCAFGVFLMLLTPAYGKVIGAVILLIGIAQLLGCLVMGAVRQQSPEAVPSPAPPVPPEVTRPLTPAQRRRLLARNLLLFLFVLFTGVPFYYYLGSMVYSRRPKQATVGRGEFYDSLSGGWICLDFPPGWQVRYRSRNPPKPHEGDIRDQHGNYQFSVYVGRLGKPTKVEDYARQTMDEWQKLNDFQKGGWELRHQEFRPGPKGQVWVLTKHLGDGNKHWPAKFGDKAVAQIEYAIPWGATIRLVEFDMLATKAAELEPIAWRAVQSATQKHPD